DLLNDSNHITELGKQAIKFGASPRLARLLLAVKASNCPELKLLGCDIAALLSERDVLQNSFEVGADLSLRVLVLQQYRQNRNTAKLQNSIFIPAMEQVIQNSRNWQRQLGVKVEECKVNQALNNLGELVAWAFPDRIALKRKGTQPRYLMANGKGALLKEDDPLITESCLVIANIDGQAKEGRVFLAAPYSLQQLEVQFSEHIDESSAYKFDESRSEVIGLKQVHYEALTLSESRLQALDEPALHACLIEALKAKKLSLLPWNETNQAWLNRARWLAQQPNALEKGLVELSESYLIDNLDNWLLPYLAGVDSIKALKRLDLMMILQAQLSYELQAEINQQAPDYYQTPSGKKVKIRYAVGQNPTVSVQLQELFGELASPKLAWNTVPLTFELLSPARRPIQVTADLANFWQSSYFEIAKEMRGRYPKHRWPEQPLKEKAGRSIKSKKVI
ncbi:MAG: ATP-dependent helicase C-terminal domain-containing protein, partial [Pseudomonadota bacterium]|nr:ATP-dependent helicase C-terminal domain-containing protein [Pseudomonadota bacterium]